MAMIACCNFPTTLLILDDDQDFLKTVQYALSSQYKCICTPDLIKAQEILTKDRGWTKSLLQDGVERVYEHVCKEDDPSAITITVNLPLLKEKIYDTDRFNHIAIVIVDYDMPEKNGLEFVQSLEDPQVKIIMLTGKAEQKTVIEAFNKKEIHRYVSKGDPNYLQTLLQYINELHQEIFLYFSEFILESLKESNTAIFKNKSFKEFFDKIIKENNIVEYYLLDEFGSFLMQDAAAEKQVWLIIKSEEEMQHLLDLAKNDKETPIQVIKRLKNRQSMPYFHTAADSTAQAQHWNLIDIQPLDEKKEYYYSIVKNGKEGYFTIDRTRVKSYQEFLKQPDLKEVSK